VLLVRKIRTLAIVLLFAVLSAGPIGQTIPLKTIPEVWLEAHHQPWVDWSVQVSPAFLDYEQRLVGDISVSISSKEIARRLNDPELDTFFVVRDAAGHSYQFVARTDLTKFKREVEFGWHLPTYFLPGDYRIAVVLYDAATKEHSLRTARMRVPGFGHDPLPHDPLPDAWRDLPTVEFAPVPGPQAQAPHPLYVPSLRGRLHLPLAPEKHTPIDVILNVDPSVWDSEGLKSLRGNISVLLAELQVVTQMDVRNASLNVLVLDLARQRVVYEQTEVAALNWPALRQALKADDPNKIEMEDLESTGTIARFFASRVGDRVSRGTPRGLIILSGPVTLEHGKTQQHSIELPAAPGAHAFYVRYLNPGGHREIYAPFSNPLAGMGGFVIWNPVELRDQLEPVLKPLSPRRFDVETPVDFRKALAAILDELGAA